MDRSVHQPTSRRSGSPRLFRLLLLGLCVVALSAVLAVDFGGAQTALAQDPDKNPLNDPNKPDGTPDTVFYNLCEYPQAIRQNILVALQYPDRDVAGAGKLGTINSDYASWGDIKGTTPNNWHYEERSLACARDPQGASIVGTMRRIGASKLASDANWSSVNQKMLLYGNPHGFMTDLRPSYFTGLTNLGYLDITGNTITQIADSTFTESLGLKFFQSRSGNNRLAPHSDWFSTKAAQTMETIIINNNGLRHDLIAHDAFDGFFNSSETTSAAASKITRINLRHQSELGHINLRWFAPLSSLDTLHFNSSIVDTYFYADGPTGPAPPSFSTIRPGSGPPGGSAMAPMIPALLPQTVRYTDGTLATEGFVDYAEKSATTEAALKAAVKAEIDRYWQASGGTGAATAATLSWFIPPDPGFNLCDQLDRSSSILPLILDALTDPDNRPETPPPARFANTGCDAGESGSVAKSHLFAGTRATWGPNNAFRPGPAFHSLRTTDLKGLDIRSVDLADSSLMSLPAGIFEDFQLTRLSIQNKLGFEVDLSSWFGTTASAMTRLATLELPGLGLTFHDIPPDEFDGFTNLQHLDIRNNPLGYVNTRWFEELTKLTKLDLGGINVAYSFYDADGHLPGDASTQYLLPYWAVAGLRTAINDVRTAHDSSSTAIDYGNGLPKVAVDVCRGRPAVFWKELMRSGHLLEQDSDTRSGSYVTNAGDVRHASYATVADDKCVPVPGNWINTTTLERVDPETTTFDNNVHDWAVSTKFLYLYDTTGLGTALNPAHFTYLYEIETLKLERSGITSIPAATFEKMPSVKTLSLSGNAFEDADLAGANFLQHFTKLNELNLDDNLLKSFSSSWLPTAMRAGATNPLRTLRLSNNPITSVDVTGLDLYSLYMSETQVASLHESIHAQRNMQVFWYQSPLLKLDGLHADGSQAFLDQLPNTIVNSEPYSYIGNESQLEDPAMDEAAVEFQLAHHSRLQAINNSTPRKNIVTATTLYDPCRPDVWSLRSISDWADTRQTGNLCLTETQKSDWISSLGDFNRATWMSAYNANFDDHLARHFIQAATGGPLERFIISGSPDAFGSGYDNSTLDRFGRSTCRWMWQLRIVGTDLNFTQASSILTNLAGAYSTSVQVPRTDANGDPVLDSNGVQIIDTVSAVVRNPDNSIQYQNEYLEHLDFSYNPDLWVGATPSGLDTFLRGVVAVKAGFGQLRLELAGTNLDHDTLKRILDSIEHYQPAPNNTHVIRALDVSENPNLWNRYNSGSRRWERVSVTEMTAMLDRLQGLTSVDIGDTGLTAGELQTVMTALSSNSRADETTHRNSGIKHSLARMELFGVADTDLSTAGTANLSTWFGLFAGRYPTAAPALRTLNLARTNIDCADLIAITDGLEAAGVLGTVSHLILDGNSRLYTDCGGVPVGPSTCEPDAVADHPLVALFKRYTNLRTISLESTGIDFNELMCVAVGLDKADGTAEDGADAVRTFNIRNNPEAFTVPARSGQAAAKASGTRVVLVFRALAQARKELVNAGLTAEQGRAVLMDLQTGQTEEEQEETENRFNAQNPGLTTVTPLPTDLSLESGRGSLRVKFTHNPMVDGEPFNVQRYEYRYRVRPTDLDADWESTGTQIWRTASLDLTTTGEKEFIIYGLEPETVYQLELRASSVGRPAVTSVTGGTSISVPQINRIEPTITEVTMRAGERVRLEVDIYGTADRLDNTLFVRGGKLVFVWSDSAGSGSFTAPNDERRVSYTAPSLPGTYTVQVQAQPDGICKSHHTSDFGITAEDRAPCIATFTVRVSRAPSDPDVADAPINPAGVIPTSLTDADGVAYTVFTPVDGGTFDDNGITITAPKGVVPDRQILGVSADVSEIRAPDAVAGASMTIAGDLYEINAIQESGDPPVMGYRLEGPLSVCLPLPDEFRANVSDVVLVQRNPDSSYGILSTKLRQMSGSLNVCGSVSALPATVGVAKLGLVQAIPVTPTPVDPQGPDAGATAPSTNMAAVALGFGVALLAMAVIFAAIWRRFNRDRQDTA